MSRKIRLALFLLFVAVFMIAAPLLVLYTAGYRFNFTTKRVSQTGVIAVSSVPKGADVAVNGVASGAKTPYVIQRLASGNYTLSLTRSGFHPWERTIDVTSGKTSYVNAIVFADVAPSLTLAATFLATAESPDHRSLANVVATKNGTLELRVADVTTGDSTFIAPIAGGATTRITLAWSKDGGAILVTLNGKQSGYTLRGVALTATALREAALPDPAIVFVDNGSNIEVRHAPQKNIASSLLALLPKSTYEQLFTLGDSLIVRDARGRLTSINRTNGSATVFDGVVTIAVPRADADEMLVTDGNEVNILGLDGTKTLITRQSESVIGLGWYASGEAVFVATKTSISAIEREDLNGHQTTTIATPSSVASFFADDTGKAVYFTGSLNDFSGLWKLRLTK